MGATTKAELDAMVTRLQRSLGRAKTKNKMLSKSLAEALEQQTATAEVLKVISNSPSDTQPVFDAIAASAARLCASRDCVVRLREGEMHRAVAQVGTIRPGSTRPIRPETGFNSRALVECRTIHVHDVRAEFPNSEAAAIGLRSVLVTPLVRDGVAIGCIVVRRAEVAPFSEKQISLLETFAAQAVIAIENVRLFNELAARNAETTEALEQQTATAEILRVISSSPTNLQPVFDAILEKATQLCGSHLGMVGLFDGEYHRFVAVRAGNADVEQWALNRGPFRPRRDGSLSQVLSEGKPYQTADLRETSQYREHRTPLRTLLVEQAGVRSLLSVPMLKGGRAIGEIHVYRAEVRAFTQKEIDLLSTFANQAVIAIENVRLFTELQASNRDLTTALDKQAAMSDILRVISRSPTDVQPVFQTIIDSAARLLGAHSGALARVAGDQIELAAFTSTNEAGDAALRAGYPYSLQSDRPQARAIRDRAPFSNPAADGAAARARGYRSLVTVPILRDDAALGTITLTRRELGGFTGDEIALLKTFADQAVIAIENSRLFKELEARNAQLHEALEYQTATAEVLGIISRSPTDVQPVLDAIVESAARVCRIDDVLLRLRENKVMVARAHFGSIPVGRHEISVDEPHVQWVREHGALHIPDIRAQNEFPNVGAGGVFHRTHLVAPLRQQGELVGALAGRRTTVSPFTPAQIKLLETFADQAVIAIENVRLFKELQAKNAEITEALEQQTAISEVLRVMSDSPTDVKPVLDTVLGRAARICEANDVDVWLLEGGILKYVAGMGEIADIRLGDTRPLDRGMAIGRAVIDGEPVHIEDVTAPEARREFPLGYEYNKRYGARTGFAVPLMREGRALGGILLRRRQVQPFTEKQINLLKTFADQAAIAIENVRLFNELQARNTEVTEALAQQTATADILRVISSSPTNLKPVFDAILEKAIQLCGSHMGTAGIFEGDTFRFVAVRAGNPEAEKWLLDRGSFHPHPGGPLSRLSEGKIVETPDMRESAGYRNRRPWQTQLVEKIGVRSTFAVPLMKDGRAIGALGIYRAEVRQFSQKEIDLVRTFADQAVIAIENVRLFNEIQNKSRQLEVANRHKSEFLANTVARAAHATERGDRFLGASAAGYGRRVERKARRVHQLRPYLRQPSAFAHQRHPRSL